MANDRWRNDQDRYGRRDEGRWREEGGVENFGSNYRQGQQGRGSDDQGDGTIAQRGFGNDRSGYDRDRVVVDTRAAVALKTWATGPGAVVRTAATTVAEV